MSLNNATGIVFGAPPPPGIQPNINKPARSAELIAVSAVFFPITVISFGIRIYTRAFLTGKLSIDDYVMMAAFASAIILLGFTIDMFRWGIGKNIWDVPLASNIYPKFMIDMTIAGAAFCLATGLAKGSILTFYLRIFTSHSMKLSVWILFIFTVGFAFATVFVIVFSCSPVEATWRLEHAETANCIDKPVFYVVHAGIGIFTDITTILAPLPLLRTLQLPPKQKVGIGLAMTVGASVCIVSSVRLKSLLMSLNRDGDVTYEMKKPSLWGFLEVNLSITGGNIPTLKPFIQHIYPGLLEISRRSRRGGELKVCWYSGGYHNTSSDRRSTTMGSSARACSIFSGRGLGNGEFGTKAFATAGAVSSDRQERAHGDYMSRVMCLRAEKKAEQQQQQQQRERNRREEYVTLGSRDQQPQKSDGGEAGRPQGWTGIGDLHVITKTVEFGFEVSAKQETREKSNISRK